MKRRRFLAAGTGALAAGRVSMAAQQSGTLRLKLDAAPEDGASCCGPHHVQVTDLRSLPLWTSMDWSNDGVLAIDLASEPVAVHLRVAVPGYGRVWITLDNQGAGYSAGDGGAPRSVLREAVASRLARCRRALAQAPAAAGGVAELGSAEERLRKGALPDALRDAIVAGEEIEFLTAQDRLAQRRPQGRISGTLFGERRGRWAIGVGPDWPYGAEPPNFLLPRPAWDTIGELCNATTLPSFWRWIEPVRGQYRWKPIDDIVEFGSRRRFAIKSFAIYWGGVGGTPTWFRYLTFDRQKPAIEQWCKTLVGRYKGQVAAWETVNEMHDWAFGNPFGWSREQILDVTRLVNELVGALDPATPRIINNCCLWGEWTQTLRPGTWCPLTYLADVIARGIPFEGVGTQYYDPGRDLMECAQHLDRFAALGKNIWITEMGTPSAPGPRDAETRQPDALHGWRGAWTPQLQASWCERWYTMALSRPALRAMNWWDMADERAFIGNAGLLDRDYRGKPAFDRLKALCRRYGVGAPGAA